MNQEKRLLLTTAVLFGVLILWSALTPPPKVPLKKEVVPATAGRETKQELPQAPEAPPGEPTENVEWGPFKIGVGRETGGIQELESEKHPLLTHADPGLLSVKIGGQAESITYTTRQEADQLVTEGVWAGRVKLTRTVSPVDEGRGYQLQVTLTATNLTESPVRIPLSVLVFRSLYAEPHDRSLLHGTFRTEEKTQDLSLKAGQSKRILPPIRWVASQAKSHVLVVRPSGWEREATFHVEHLAPAGIVGWLETEETQLPPSGSKEWALDLYAGPLALDHLERAGLEEALSFGAFSGTARWLLKVLRWSEGWLHSYGWAICLLGIAVCLVFAPVTLYSSWMSMQMMHKMAAVRPQESRIRKEHKDNPQKMHQELMELYRKHRINPASGCLGCLPLLLTWPIYIALFQVLTRAPELTGARFLLIRDLAQPDRIIPLPVTLPLIGSGVNVLPFLAVASILWQQKMMQPASTMTDEQKAQQEIMKKIMPVMFLAIFYALPSGFMLYLVVNSALTAALQSGFKQLAK